MPGFVRVLVQVQLAVAVVGRVGEGVGRVERLGLDANREPRILVFEAIDGRAHYVPDQCLAAEDRIAEVERLTRREHPGADGDRRAFPLSA